MISQRVPLGRVLTRWATPVLAAAGFTRASSTYRWQAPNGNWAMVDFQRSRDSRSGPDTVFYVNIGVAPLAHLELMAFLFPDRRTALPDPAGGLWHSRILPPEDVEHRPGTYRSDQWSYRDEEGAARVGQHLERIVPRQVLPRLTALVDPVELRREKGDPINPVALLTLLVDDGPSPALDDALERCRLAGRTDVVEWALRRLAQHAG